MSTFEKQKNVFKIIVIGDSGTGKTCLTLRFCNGKFPKTGPEYTSGVNFLEKTVNVDGEPLSLHLWDTAGQERFRRSMIPGYYRKADGVVFVYDVTDITSFQKMNFWIEELKHYHGDGPDIPKILVGNKCDCVSQKAVNTNAAKKFADAHGMSFLETSASDDNEANHVKEIFMTLARKLKRNRKPMMPDSPSPTYAEQPSIKLTSADLKKDDSCCTC